MHVVDVLTDRLRQLMREHGVKAAPLARRANLNESAVRDILRGRSRNPGIVTLTKIAGVLKLRPSALYEQEQTWTVVGQVEGDGSVTRVAAGEVRPSAVVNPFFAMRSEEFATLLVRGSGLAPLAFEGDYLVFQTGRVGVAEEDLGRPCVVVFENGRMAVRLVRPGDQPGKYHLSPVGLYGAPEANASVKSAARVALTLSPAFVPNLPEPTHVVDGSTLHEEGATYRAE